MDSQNKKDIVLHELENAHSCLREGEYLLDGSFFNAAITRLYYACFHAASGLLITSGFVVFTHSGVRTLLGKEFIQTGKLDIVWGRFYTQLFNKRQDEDYATFVYFTRKEVEEILPQAIAFVTTTEELIKKALFVI